MADISPSTVLLVSSTEDRALTDGLKTYGISVCHIAGPIDHPDQILDRVQPKVVVTALPDLEKAARGRGIPTIQPSEATIGEMVSTLGIRPVWIEDEVFYVPAS